MTERSEYKRLSRKALEERLAAAEDVCLMYGWSPVRRGETDREKALYILWSRWTAIGPSAAPSDYPHLDDDAVEAMAAERDARRDETLKRIAAPA